MKRFYVIGTKTSKSLSPMIFNYWFKKYRIKATYGFLELTDTNFDKKITKLLKNEKLAGLNITIPYKKKIMKYVELINKNAKEINAINCISTSKKIKGTNTDWEGYYKTLPKGKILKNKKILLIGYGGAALAIHYVLKNKGYKNILIFNRTRKKTSFSNKREYTKNLSSLKKHLSSAELIINTTPTNPIKKNERKLINRKTILSDIVYVPKETAFLKSFPNNRKIYGISMLLQQAVLCFKLWFGFKPIIDKYLIELLDKKIS